jgi:hypothetical protein
MRLDIWDMLLWGKYQVLLCAGCTTLNWTGFGGIAELYENLMTRYVDGIKRFSGISDGGFLCDELAIFTTVMTEWESVMIVSETLLRAQQSFSRSIHVY